MADPAPFISQQDLTDYIGRDVTTDNGAAMAVGGACQMIRDLAEQDFNGTTSMAVLDGTGTDVLVLPQFPVSKAGTVLVDGGTITDYMLTDNGLLLRGTAGDNPRPLWPLGRQNVQITYDHGYTVVPQSVRMVALAIAARLIVQGVADTETVGDVTIDYGGRATDFTKGEMAIIYGFWRKRSF
jgi:hypothetical protein